MREGNTLAWLSRVNEMVVYLLLRYARYGGARVTLSRIKSGLQNAAQSYQCGVISQVPATRSSGVRE